MSSAHTLKRRDALGIDILVISGTGEADNVPHAVLAADHVLSHQGAHDGLQDTARALGNAIDPGRLHTCMPKKHRVLGTESLKSLARELTSLVTDVTMVRGGPSKGNRTRLRNWQTSFEDLSGISAANCGTC